MWVFFCVQTISIVLSGNSVVACLFRLAAIVLVKLCLVRKVLLPFPRACVFQIRFVRVIEESVKQLPV